MIMPSIGFAVMLAEFAGGILGVDHCGEGRDGAGQEAAAAARHFVVPIVRSVLELEPLR